MSGSSKPTQWYKRDWVDFETVKNNPTRIEDLHNALSEAVHRQLMSDVPYGVLLSGGLDSSITSALAKSFPPNVLNQRTLKMPGGLNCTPFL